MNAEDLKRSKQLAGHWREAGPLLEEARQEELLQMTPENRRAASLAILDLVANLPRERTTSGFVEQQRIFMRARR